MDDRSPMWVAVLLSAAAGLVVLLLGGVALFLAGMSSYQSGTCTTSSRGSSEVVVGLAFWVILAFLVPYVSALDHKRLGVLVGLVAAIIPGLLLGSAVLSSMRPQQFVPQWCF
jgi:1,4-dihydroxy-2-naphthoate octaprenyltransferase